KEGARGDAGALCQVVQGIDGTRRGESGNPDLVDGRYVGSVAALYCRQKSLLIFGIRNGRDLDLDAGIFSLEALDCFLLILAQARFRLLVVPEFENDVL